LGTSPSLRGGARTWRGHVRSWWEGIQLTTAYTGGLLPNDQTVTIV